VQIVSLPVIPAAALITAAGGYTSFTVLRYVSRATSQSNFANALSRTIIYPNIGGGQLYTDSGGENARAVIVDNAGSTGQRFAAQSLAAGAFVGAGYKTMLGVMRTDGSGYSIIDNAAGVATISTSGSAPPPPFTDGSNPGGLLLPIGTSATFQVVLSFHAFFFTPVPDVVARSIRAIYAATLGKGLGL
jgi:hypothetical protein